MISLDNLMSIPTIYRASVSPDNKKILMLIHRVHENLDLFLSEAAKEKGFKPVTHSPQVTILRDWFPDSHTLLISEDVDRNERDTLYKITLDNPNDYEVVTEKNPNYYTRGGMVSPDGSFIIYSINYDFTGKKETENFKIVRHDLATGERKVLAETKRPGFIIPILSPDGKNVLYNRNDIDPSGDQWWLVTVNGENDREILNFGDKAKIAATWTYDNKIAFITDTIDGARQNKSTIGIYDPDTGNIEYIIKGNDAPYYFESIRAPRNQPYLVLIEVKNARTFSYIYDLKTKTLTPVHTKTGNLVLLHPYHENPQEWLAYYYSSTNPTDIVIVDTKTPDPESFFNITDVLTRTSIKREDLVPAQDFTWESVDGTKIHGWVFIPDKKNGKTIVYVHGGPTAHVGDEMNVQIQYFCSLGFTMFAPNYRGSTGYGVDFKELIKKDGWGGLEQEDIRTGIQALIDKGIATPGKIGITGTSYGGYSSWWAITHFPTDLIAASAPICGMTDLVVDYYTTRPDLRIYSEEMLGGSPEDVPEKYKERSPINYIHNIKGKLLIVQGGQDPNVTPENVRVVEEKLKEANIPYEKLVFEDEGHGIFKPKNQKVLYKKLAEFFQNM